ncbi:MAG: hypothetical protein WCH34_01585 [Bacteroidota bacterium]
MNTLAKIISYLFHPLFVPLYAVFFFFQFDNYSIINYPLSYKLIVLSIVFITTILVPVLLIYVFYRRKYIQSFEMQNKEERILPFILISIFYFITYNMFHQLRLPSIFQIFTLGGCILTLLVLFINYRWKISVHTTAWGTLLGVFIAISLIYSIEIPFFIPAIIMVSGIVGFARLQLDAHTPLQIYAGFLLGAVAMFLMVFSFA